MAPLMLRSASDREISEPPKISEHTIKNREKASPGRIASNTPMPLISTLLSSSLSPVANG